MKFSVVVKLPDGSEENRMIDAKTRFAVYEQIEKEGASVLTLEEGKGGGMPKWANISFGGGHIKSEQRITLTKNLSAMLTAGLTLSRALSVIERQSKNKYLKTVVSTLETAVKSGLSFHEGLQQFPKVFSPLFIAMTKAGEESGKLSDSLKVVSKQMESSEALTKKIKGAMIYPSIILVAIVIIGILMLVFVVPTLASTFASFGGTLPLATRIIIAMSDFVVKNVILVVILVAGVIGGFMYFIRTKIGSAIMLFAALHMPVIGELTRETMSARAARTLSSLLSSGVEMLSAIEITGEVVGKNVFGKVLVEAGERVKKGEQLSTTFESYPKLYPLLFTDMIAVGEETGKVSEMLGQVAEYYEGDVEDRTKDLSTIIEPLLMLFIGAFVGVFAIAMIAPIYSLSSTIS
ncbi:MAG: ral secretion pathway protein [Parcubacteria group bacterium]|nr:ral secretion pathway protein [Parcubacteria group bacterium]